MIRTADIQYTSAIRSVRRLLRTLDGLQTISVSWSLDPALAQLAQNPDQHAGLITLLQCNPFASLAETQSAAPDAAAENNRAPPRSAAPAQQQPATTRSGRGAGIVPTTAQRTNTVQAQTAAQKAPPSTAVLNPLAARAPAAQSATAQSATAQSAGSQSAPATGGGLVAQLLQQHSRRLTANATGTAGKSAHPARPAPSALRSLPSAAADNKTERLAQLRSATVAATTPAPAAAAPLQPLQPPAAQAEQLLSPAAQPTVSSTPAGASGYSAVPRPPLAGKR
jgi:hypothetical protein